ncbi:MAG: NAD(P)-binding domain-containing protein [Planctomycetota bacterium]|nr:NAD(P)-binding domain-containing protein [Planctomycetota bacterium]
MMAIDVLIIGAGPIGLETTAALRSSGLDVLCVDAGPIGGTIFTLFPPNTRFFSSPERLAIAGVDLQVPAQEKASREEYLAYLRGVVNTLDLPVQTYQMVVAATRDQDRWEVTTTNRSGQKTLWSTAHVVLAIGGTHRVRRLGVPGEDLGHVEHDLGDPHRFFGRNMVIVGGKNSAAEAALRCWRVGARVTIVHRGDQLHERVKYWIRPEVDALIEEGRIDARFNANVKEIDPDGVVIESDRGLETIPCQDVLLMIGYEQDPGLLDLFGVEREGPQSAPVHDSTTMCTNQPGVFVAGTAVAGTQQRFRTYIENAHVHAGRILAAIQGTPPPPESPPRSLPEA